MLFTSHVFTLVFLPIVMSLFLLCYRYLGLRSALSSLSIASLIFYGWWNPAYLGLIITSIIFNYAVGIMLGSSHTDQQSDIFNRKTLLIIGVSANLLSIGYFKYAGFFTNNVNQLFDTTFDIGNIILPLAISFFTFQQIAYLVGRLQW